MGISDEGMWYEMNIEVLSTNHRSILRVLRSVDGGHTLFYHRSLSSHIYNE